MSDNYQAEAEAFGVIVSKEQWSKFLGDFHYYNTEIHEQLIEYRHRTTKEPLARTYYRDNRSQIYAINKQVTSPRRQRV